MADRSPLPSIYVLAGTNGAGKSSIGGAMFLQQGINYFDPDKAASRILSANPGISLDAANSAAWHEGRRLLERVIAEQRSFVFETTLGGRTITGLLERALRKGLEVRMWYVGLNSPELHIARVRSRAMHGGHDIPAASIRARYDSSRLNLIRLLPHLTELRLFDNSAEADLQSGNAPRLQFILHMKRGRIVSSCEMTRTPNWAKPIVAAALKI